MGQKTRTQIITAGLEKAGDTSLSTLAVTWFNAGLRSRLYAGWPWPFLQEPITGLVLGAGVTSLTVGAGTNYALEIRRIMDPIWVGDSTYQTRARARIRTLTGGSAETHEALIDPNQGRGTPIQFKARMDRTLWGRWKLIPYPVPDKAYLVHLDVIVQPADTTSDSDIPVYPNDETLIKLVEHAALEYMHGSNSPEAQAALDQLTSMVIGDRGRYGEVPGTNDVIELDENIFL